MNESYSACWNNFKDSFQEMIANIINQLVEKCNSLQFSISCVVQQLDYN